MKLPKTAHLPLWTLLSVLGSIAFGLLFRAAFRDFWTERHLKYLEFCGELFLRALKCLTIPLMMSGVVSAVGRLDPRTSRKVAFRAMGYYVGTTVMAIAVGVALVLIIHPGRGESAEELFGKSGPRLNRKILPIDAILDLARNLVPDNLMVAFITQTATTLSRNPSNSSSEDLSQWHISIVHSGGTNIIGLVSVSIICGLFIGRLARLYGRSLLLELFIDLSETCSDVAALVVKLTPFGVVCLIMPRIIEVKDPELMLKFVGKFALTVIAGLSIHGLVVIPVLYSAITRHNPYKFIKMQLPALSTAFATSSSSATLPLSISCLEEGSGIHRNIVRFVVPLGTSLNMDGTALYEAVAAIFIAQSRQMQLDWSRVLIVAVTATAASVGAAGIPQAGLVTMVIVLEALGLPEQDISLVFIVDWLLDRFRTLINVLSDAFGAAIVEHLSSQDLIATFCNPLDERPTPVPERLAKQSASTTGSAKQSSGQDVKSIYDPIHFFYRNPAYTSSLDDNIAQQCGNADRYSPSVRA